MNKKSKHSKKQSRPSLLGRFFIRGVLLYQKYISPLKTASSCIFYPTCSEYAIISIKKNGVIKGVFFACYRIFRCNPWNKSEYIDKP